MLAFLGHVGCVSWLTTRALSLVGHVGRILIGPHGRAVLGTAPRLQGLGHMGGPSWGKRVAFLGTAPRLQAP